MVSGCREGGTPIKGGRFVRFLGRFLHRRPHSLTVGNCRTPFGGEDRLLARAPGCLPASGWEGGMMSNIPVARRRYRQNPPLPSWRQPPMGKLRGTYLFLRNQCERLFVVVGLLGCLAFKAQFAPRARTLDAHPQPSWASLIPSLPPPSLFRSAPPTASLAPHRLRWQSLPIIPSLEHLHPTLSTRRIQSVILSSTLLNGTIIASIITAASLPLTTSTLDDPLTSRTTSLS